MSRTRAFPPFSAHRPRRFARAEVQPGAEVASSGLSTNHPSAAKPTIKPPRRQGGNPSSPTPRRHPRPRPGKIDRPNYFATSVVPQVHDLGAHVCTISSFLCHYGEMSRMAKGPLPDFAAAQAAGQQRQQSWNHACGPASPSGTSTASPESPKLHPHAVRMEPRSGRRWYMPLTE